MKKRLNRRGFTMAELLVVVAIMIILFGVAFITVINYQRSMALLERDATAKELFIAAQNHLTMAESQGLLGVSNYGTKGTANDDTDKDIYYIVVTDGKCSDNDKNMFNLMLPFGSIDDTIRVGGSYVIRFQIKPALVLDVFYCSTHGNPERFNHDFHYDKPDIMSAEYNHLVNEMRDKDGENETSKRNDRRTYTYDEEDNRAVLGWFGGEKAKAIPTITLNPPEIQFINAEKLYAVVTDTNLTLENAINPDISLTLIITGVTSKTQKSFTLDNASYNMIGPIPDYSDDVFNHKYTIILDDITKSGLHFKDLSGENGTDHFIPGEDVTVQAVATAKTIFSNVAYSRTITRNSLFADGSNLMVTGKEEKPSAYIQNMRHLENLGNNVSGVTYQNTVVEGASETKYGTKNTLVATQITDLNWSEFKKEITILERIKDTVENPNAIQTRMDALTVFGVNGATTNKGDFLPIIPDSTIVDSENNAKLEYIGRKHSISEVTIGKAGDSSNAGNGLFDRLYPGSSVSDLVLKDFTVHGSGDAGCLAGIATETTVTNVLAYNTKDNDPKYHNTDGNEHANVKTDKAAGGLIGLMRGGSINYSAAAVIVYSQEGDAGGLIGRTESATTEAKVTGCYSGGHVNKQATIVGTYSSENINVKSDYTDGNAGGLIGRMDDTDVHASYSTCSVRGATAGGFIGSGEGTISISYCTGLVQSTGEEIGAFAGNGDDLSFDKCRYLSIVNYLSSEHRELRGVNDTNLSSDKVNAFDSSKNDYDRFMNNSSITLAEPYETRLTKYYQGRYPFRSIETLVNLDSAVNLPETFNSYFVTSHYGDWPVPELFVINKPKP